mgnify:CR=1 FL=1
MTIYGIPVYPGVRIKGNKFRAKKTEVNGIVFDSKKEADRYFDLCMLEKAGEIKDLKRQVEYELIPTHVKSDGKKEQKCTYIADFTYINNKTGGFVVEDVKGLKKGASYQVFVIKRKLMLDRWGIEIKEV